MEPIKSEPSGAVEAEAKASEIIDMFNKAVRSVPGDIKQEDLIKYEKNVKIALKLENRLMILTRIEKVLVDILECNTVEECKSKVTKNSEDSFIICTETAKPCVIKLRNNAVKMFPTLKDKFIFSAISSLEEPLLKIILAKIDPEGTVFQNRVYRDNEFEENPELKQHLLFPASHHMSIIFDTTNEHWKTEEKISYDGYIFITPYIFFKPTGSMKVSEFIELPTRNKNDYVLNGVTEFVINIHFFFYQKKVDALVASINFAQRAIFRNLIICVTFVDDDKADALYSLACRYGGKVVTVYDPTVTHLIVNNCKDHTIKIANGYKGVHIVDKQWMIDCCTNYQKKEEMNYPIIGVVSPTEGAKDIEYPSESSDLQSSEIDMDDIGYSEADDAYSDSEEEELDLEEIMKLTSSISNK